MLPITNDVSRCMFVHPQIKINIFFFLFSFPVPRVSIDGKSHAEIMLIAIGCGVFFASVILITLTAFITCRRRRLHVTHPEGKVIKSESFRQNVEVATSMNAFGTFSGFANEKTPPKLTQIEPNNIFYPVDIVKKLGP